MSGVLGGSPSRAFSSATRRVNCSIIAAYNFGRRLKTLKGFTPYEFICKAWTKEPQRFRLNPIQQMPGLNSQGAGVQILNLVVIQRMPKRHIQAL